MTRTTEYHGYTIKPKLDMPRYGCLINGKRVNEGVVVVKDGCNAMPAAAWFQSEAEALVGIDALVVAGGDPDKWWSLMRMYYAARKEVAV